MDVFVVGTSHSVASVADRERLHVGVEEVHRGLQRLLGKGDVLYEAVPLATCGRLELYGVSTDPDRASKLLVRMLGRRVGATKSDLHGRFYVHHGADAVRHLIRVAAGLDSVVHGEAQILGQVRDAAHDPLVIETKGQVLHRLFDTALAAGKRVRHETDIGRGAASLASAALETMQREMGSLASSTALVLGAGETGALVARLLRKAGVGRLIIANRTVETAVEVAGEVGGVGVGLDDMLDRIAEADLVVGAVTADQTLVTRDALAGLGVTDDPKRRFFLDLAHPRNFDFEIGEVPGVTLVDLDQVFQRVERAKSARAEQVPLAEEIVDEQVEAFGRWLRGREVVPVLRAVREEVLALASDEAHRLGQGKSAEERAELQRLARSIARTLLHAPTMALREMDPGTPEGRAMLESAHTLFGVGGHGGYGRIGRTTRASSRVEAGLS